MLAVSCLRLAAGMLGCLLVLPRGLIHPRFYRTHFLTALGLPCLASLSAPSLSLRPLLRLLAALALAVLARLAVDGCALWRWTGVHSFGNLSNDVLLWLPVRWAVGFAAPLGLDWMAWQAARIRSTQS